MTIKDRSGARQQARSELEIACCEAITELIEKLENELTAELKETSCKGRKSFRQS